MRRATARFTSQKTPAAIAFPSRRRCRKNFPAFERAKGPTVIRAPKARQRVAKGEREARCPWDLQDSDTGLKGRQNTRCNNLIHWVTGANTAGGSCLKH